MVEFTGERVIPGQVNEDLWSEHVARYAFQLAQSFSNFYHEFPVLSETNPEKKTFLLWMTDYFRVQLERTLSVLGIEVPEYM